MKSLIFILFPVVLAFSCFSSSALAGECESVEEAEASLITVHSSLHVHVGSGCGQTQVKYENTNSEKTYRCLFKNYKVTLQPQASSEWYPSEGGMDLIRLFHPENYCSVEEEPNVVYSGRGYIIVKRIKDRVVSHQILVNHDGDYHAHFYFMQDDERIYNYHASSLHPSEWLDTFPSQWTSIRVSASREEPTEAEDASCRKSVDFENWQKSGPSDEELVKMINRNKDLMGKE